jgi:hypothetical protein
MQKVNSSKGEQMKMKWVRHAEGKRDEENVHNLITLGVFVSRWEEYIILDSTLIT